jgi:tetratricopeptide (TPR) repeat protein
MARTTQDPVSRIRRTDDIHVVDSDDKPSELVRLVLPEQPQRNSDSVEAGDVLADRYRVLDKVAHSGMGMVCKALDRRREEAGSPFPWVALKFARAWETDASETSAHLRQEFLTLSQLNHPNIVSVFDFAHDGGLDFLVMEWLEGETLAELLGRITSKRIALGKAEDIVRSIASALAHAHDLGLVHGDVKPSNIFLTRSRAIKLVDFGSCPPRGGDGSEGNWATRAYASPEVLHGRAPRASDDVYALGVTAYYLLSGDRPFGELDASDAREQGILPLPLPADSRERWPAVEHALKPDAEGRPPNAREFLREFDEPLADGAEAPPATPVSHVAYGAIAVGLLIAMVAWSVGTIGVPKDVEYMLANGQRAMDEGQLVQPADENAFTYFSSVLEVAPRNAEAREGLRSITETYLTRARESLAAGHHRRALENLDIARRVMPEHYGVGVTGDLIGRHGRDLLQAAGGSVDDDPEQAEVLVERAAELLPPEDAQVARVRKEIREVQAERELENLLRQIDERILAERLLVPSSDSAVALLRQARRMAPDDRQVALAADRIATALLFQAMFATSNDQLQDAARYLEAARGLGVRHMALARAEYELARARREALAARRAAGR